MVCPFSVFSPADPKFLKGQCRKIFCFWFFHESVPPLPQSIPYGPFQIFSKICGDIHKSRCSTGANETGSKTAPGINDTGGKFATGFNAAYFFHFPFSMALML
jgi:hypothetical protein